ncbi:exopolysaccharide biosynthesis polyprenyl glycosylphosphotransferase [Roseomonas frigidaquae]|uniref:Exopolysaccharide biosynthesis polyprenyl glycosylphosphotransferase n=1 Tax=Falsiroseomonas frigidaquae TaxID=487318 RepID=A0ABX1EZB3_9PROT|nr:exopolysaccharide biosynthesis polyprenyl glycosylphosphotransferase [Falsiroseomonas frigidaquae]NKE45426.1 exopolysaccharide biosynthesis polyprenyl glycosylphosphotransferase [Falsiroseomonas frigidaquae]
MTNLFGHSVRSEVLALCLGEAAAVFVCVLGLLVVGGPFGAAEGAPSAVALAAITAATVLLVAGAVGLYEPSTLAGLRATLVSGLVGTTILLLLSVLALQFTAGDGISPVQRHALVSVLLGTAVAILFTRLGFLLLRPPLRRLALVGAEKPGADKPDRGYAPFEVTLALPMAEALSQAITRGRLRAWRVWAVVAPSRTPLPADTRQHCAAAGVHVFTAAEFSEHGLNRLDLETLPAGWLATAKAAHTSRAEAALRRGFDIFVASSLLLLTLPLLLVTMLAIRLDSRGPIFYRQERVGQNNRPFMLFKFRSMVTDAEAGGVARWAIRGDPRVTRIGRIMRLTRIDEIPQAINVLRGDMSVVGPRPERPTFVAQLGEIIPHYHDRAIVKPGITGWAQVNYPYGASVEDARMKLAYDLYYVRRRSLLLDLLILLSTVRVVLFQEGAR